MEKYLLGSPKIAVQTVPRSDSTIGNYVYGFANRDGLTLWMPLANFYLDQLAGRKHVKFDVREFNWIGTQEKTPMILYMRADAPYKSIGDIINASSPPTCGAIRTDDASYVLAKILEETLGAKIDLNMGYSGGREIDEAVEKGKVICRGMTISAHFGREPFINWHIKRFDRHLVQSGRELDPRPTEAPTIYDLMDEYKTPEISRRVAQVLMLGQEFGRPMLAPPGVPPDRVRLLREAYVKTVKDPGLLAEAKERKMDMEPSSGEELQALVNKVMDQPAEVILRVKQLLETEVGSAAYRLSPK